MYSPIPYKNMFVINHIMVSFNCKQYIVMDQIIFFPQNDCLENNEGYVNKYCRRLTFPPGSFFNRKIILSKYIECLIFGYHYNKTIVLTKKLAFVEFGDRYNRHVNLSKNLTHFVMGWNYNNQLELPKNLKHLTSGYHFNKIIILPKHLKYLILGHSYCQPLIINPNMVVLSISSSNYHILDELSNSLKKIIFIGKSIGAPKNNLPCAKYEYKY